MLNNTLNTNEVRDAGGVEREFTHLQQIGRTREFQQIAETPNLRHRIQIAHREVGALEDLRRQSKVGILKEITGASGKKRKIVFNVTADIPVGDMGSTAEAANVLSEVGSLVFTLGTNTFLYDGTGNGAKVLLNGEL